VLRFDAEAYETIDGLAAAILATAAQRLAGTLEKAGDLVKRWFTQLRPDVAYDLAEQKITVRFGVVPAAEAGRVPVLTDVLHAVERLAAEHKRQVAVVLDEFQQIVAEGGATAERQLRAAVQTHRHVAYVFAGSQTRLLNAMTSDPARAFWKLGARLFLGPIPRADFLEFLGRGFADARFTAREDALVHILDVAEDVPYNVQQLANAAWETLRVAPSTVLTPVVVDRVLGRLVAREHPTYAQLWNGLTKTQKLVLRAVIEEGGQNLISAAVLTRRGIAPSTMHKTLRALDDRGRMLLIGLLRDLRERPHSRPPVVHGADVRGRGGQRTRI
jgi:hypothetical protein